MAKRMAMVFALGLWCLAGHVTISAAGSVEVHFINVGQGDCELINCGDGRVVVVDCGSSLDQDPKGVRTYLAEHACKKEVDVLVISHPHDDHFNMLPFVLADFQIRKVVMVGHPSDYAPKGKTTDKMNAYGRSAEEPDAKFRTWVEGLGDRILRVSSKNCSKVNEPSSQFGNGEVKFHILAADDGPASKPNARSIVLMVTLGKFNAILAGDAEGVTQDEIMKRFSDSPGFLDCEVYKVAHHGSRSSRSNAPEWLDVIQPEVSVFSAALENTYGHPNRQVIKEDAEEDVSGLETYALPVPGHRLRVWSGANQLDRATEWRRYRKALFLTATNGSIVVTSNGGNCTVRWGTSQWNKGALGFEAN